MTKTAVLFFALLSSSIGFAAPPRCAVLGFRPEKASVTDSLASVISADLVKSRLVTIVERSRLELLVKELKLTNGGLIDQTSAPQMGQIKDVKYLIYGTLLSTSSEQDTSFESMTLNGKSGTTLTKVDAEVRVTDVETGEIILDEKVHGESHVSGLQAAIDDVANKFVKKMATVIRAPDVNVIDVQTDEKQLLLDPAGGGVQVGDTFEVGKLTQRKTTSGVVISKFERICYCQVTKIEDGYADAIVGDNRRESGKNNLRRDNDYISKLYDLATDKVKLVARLVTN